MNKKANTALFIVGATIANILLMFVLIIIGIVLIRLIFPHPQNSQLVVLLFLVVFLGSIAGSFFIYHRVVQFISKRVDMEKYFHPIFRPRRK